MLVLTTEIEYENQVKRLSDRLNDPMPAFCEKKDWEERADSIRREIEGLDIEHYADY